MKILTFGMNKRERYLVGFACIFILAAAGYNFGISPLLEQQKVLERQLSAKKNALETLSRLSEEYNQILRESDSLTSMYAKRDPGFTLFAFLETIAVKAGLNNHIDYMKPSSVIDKVSKAPLSVVEMKLKRIKLSQLVSYLYLVELSEHIVFIKRLSITSDGKDQHTISATLQVETYVNE
jgi:general secretion pathway protein M